MNKEQPIKGKEEIIQAQLELVQGYYNKIYIDNLSQETILNMLERDREFLQQEQNVIDANNLASKSETPQSGEERLLRLIEEISVIAGETSTPISALRKIRKLIYDSSLLSSEQKGKQSTNHK